MSDRFSLTITCESEEQSVDLRDLIQHTMGIGDGTDNYGLNFISTTDDEGNINITEECDNV